MNSKKIVLSIALVTLVLSAFAQDKLSNGTKLLLLERQAAQSTSPFYQRLVTDDNKVPAYIHFYDALDAQMLEELGVEVNNVYENIGVATVIMPINVIEQLAEQEWVKEIEVGTPVYPKLNLARVAGHVDAVHAGEGELPRAYTGKNVVIGVCDGGFQFDHIAFRDANGDTRLKKVWLQDYSASSHPAPSGFTYGGEFSTQEDIFQRQLDSRTDDVGHGSHVMGIAAGSDRENEYYGVAPDADLVAISFSERRSADVTLSDAVRYTFNYAKSVGKPAVVNLSLGSHTGPHDGTSTFDRIIETLVEPGYFVVGAVGNEGNDKFHTSKTFTENDTLLKSMVKFGSSSSRYGQLQFWGSVGGEFEINMVFYNKNTKQIIAETGYMSMSRSGQSRKTITGYHNEVADSAVAVANLVIATGVNSSNNEPSAQVVIEVTKLPSYNVYLGFIVKAKSGYTHVWTDDYYCTLTNNRDNDWSDGDSESTMGEIGGSGRRTISVGASVTDPHNTKRETGQIGDFSSKGPTPDGRIKPDIAAPGCYLVSAVPNTVSVLNGSSFDQAKKVTKDGQDYYYSYMMGTSMASPFASGVLALWLEANPQLTYDQVIDVFAKTSIRDEFTGEGCPNNLSGYGKINAYAGLLYVLGISQKVQDDAMPTSMVLYPNPTTDQLNIGFTRADSDVEVSIYSVDGRQVLNHKLGSVSAGNDAQINVSSLPVGTYVVRVMGAQTCETSRIIIK